MKVLITGASGFLGYELTNKFLKNNFSVISIYNKKKPNFKKNNKLKLIKRDLIKNKLNIKCDIIVHCASITPVNSTDGKKLYYSNLKILENLNKFFPKIKMFFFMSTMSVYGQVGSKIITEKSKPIRPNYYGKSKLFCEKKLLDMHKKYKKTVIVMRLPGVVGKTSHSNFITRLIEKILKKQVVQVNNLNSKFNNIVHSDDIYNFISNIIKKKNKRIPFGKFSIKKSNENKKYIKFFNKKN